MNCIYCGNEVQKDALCCPKCGGSVTGGIKKMAKASRRQDNEIQFSVQSSVIPLLVFTRLFPLFFLVAALSTAIAGTVLMLFLELISFHYGIYSYCVVGAACLYLMVYAPIATIIKNTKLSRYTFLKDRIEYIEGGISREVKKLEYTTILDMNVTKGILQKSYNLGTIRIFAVGSTQDFMIVLRDVKNADRTFRKIVDLVEKR